jgi:putative ABC transport system substrate-binding protein
MHVVILVLGMLLVAPLPARAQDVAEVPRLGFVHAGWQAANMKFIEAFRRGLQELGYIEGRNILIEERWAEGRTDRLRDLTAELVRTKVEILVTHTVPAALAAKLATRTIPIIVVVGDPLSVGLLARIVRPDGNITQLPQAGGEDSSGKWLELLNETVPKAAHVAVLWNPTWFTRLSWRELRAAALARRMTLHSVEVQHAHELDRAFTIAKSQAQALIVLPDPMTVQSRARIVDLAAKSQLPAMYGMKEFVEAGGLMAYGVDQAILFRRAAVYVDRMLKGKTPADLPADQSSRFELSLNLKTANALGLTIPPSLLSRLDRVIAP